jgi:hypothetical protein
MTFCLIRRQSTLWYRTPSIRPMHLVSENAAIFQMPSSIHAHSLLPTSPDARPHVTSLFFLVTHFTIMQGPEIHVPPHTFQTTPA